MLTFRTPVPWLAVCALFFGQLAAQAATPTTTLPLRLQPQDRIAIVGNTLAERMQHFGHFEALLQQRFPKHELVVRNLGFPGDELTMRLRSAGFGSPDDHLKFVEADVVFAFFGYNESYNGEPGLAKFKQALREFVHHTLAQKYNGTSAPRLVLFSPISHEDLRDPNLPDGKANNARLALYTSAMAEVAKAEGVGFVDLFTPTSQSNIFRGDTRPATINGVHLNQRGDFQVALIIDRALFGPRPSRVPSEAQFERLRRAVTEKDFTWFQRYRTTDGYSIFGGRADLKFVDGQTNREVMQRELEILNVMTANRDKRVWAVAQGTELPVDDGNTPPFIEVISNKPGPLPGGKHEFLSGQASIDKMTVAKNMKVQLFASEELFPEMVNPVQMAFDTQGRLWVAVWESYPHWKPKDELNDKLLILEDTNGDGQADKCTRFAEHLHNPTGFEFWGGGVLVGTAPDLLFLKDTDGDDKADTLERVITGLDSADTHHGSNSFTLDPGGALYFQEGTFHHTQVETPYGPPVRLANAGVFRYEPRTQKFEVYVSYGFANPHGHAFDFWGQDIVVDGTGAVPYHAALFSGRIDFPNKHNTPPTVYKQRTRPCSGIEFLSSAHFPDELQGNLLVANVIGFQGILQYKMSDKGASFTAEEVEPIVYSSDPNFRPTDIEIGPDGAIYFCDWQNPIIGHMQHNLRDPNRDRTHGRVYRVSYEGRPFSKSPQVAGEGTAKLLDLLRHGEARVRYRARIELSARPGDEVAAEVAAWLKKLDPSDPQYEHLLLEGLWVYQHHNLVRPELLEQLLSAKSFQARAAAVRVLCYQRDRVPGALELVKKAAADEHPRVRLEAIRTASFFDVPEAIEVVVIADQLPSDEYLSFLRGETLRALEPTWKKALADRKDIAMTTDAGKRYWLAAISTDQLVSLEPTRDVCREMLRRPGLLDERRREASVRLARLESKSELQVVIDTIWAIDAAGTGADSSVVFDLVRQLTQRSSDELAAARAEIEKLATTAQQPVLRQIGFASLVGIDRSADRAWQLAAKSTRSLGDFVDAMPLVADASLRAGLYDKIEPLVEGLPDTLATGKPLSPLGRYVRIGIPGKATLTLAEVEVMSGGQNLARRGKATQKNTAHGGDAARAIDGNTNGSYGSGSQTHTEENTADPWWEVDLGVVAPIESIVVHNRTDGYLGKRLDGFKVRILDANRQEVFLRHGIEAPRKSATIDVGQSDPAAGLRRSAMLALTYVRGQEPRTFATLARFLADDANRAAAIRALQRLPQSAWPKDRAQALLNEVVGYLSKLPTDLRTSPDALDAMQFAESLAGLLPSDKARLARAQLGELGVRVVRLGTLFERMSYDQDVLAVKVGKPVEFVFENSDLMPHNFVIVRPGSLEEVGLLAEANAQKPGFAERQFVPDTKSVLLASGLLQPRGTEKLSFVAPTEPGVYPYVCTYPGHWRRMYGALYVVEDLDAYLDNPESYLASHPLEVKDSLLKDRRPRTEWSLGDLAGAVEALRSGRSYGNGKQMFQVANCVACHKLDGVGTEIGPDLTKLDAKLGSLDILKELLDPSARINEKYQTYTFELESGKVVTGLILAEDKDRIKVIENPLAKTEAIEFKPSEVTERHKSAASIMPKGLLDKLSREEILDLVAYVTARGNSKLPLFEGGHDHKHGGH